MKGLEEHIRNEETRLQKETQIYDHNLHALEELTKKMDQEERELAVTRLWLCFFMFFLLLWGGEVAELLLFLFSCCFANSM